MSNDESLIYVLVTLVFRSVHFRHFVGLKMRFLGWKCDFCSFVNGSYEVNDFGYTSVGIRNICEDYLFLNV